MSRHEPEKMISQRIRWQEGRREWEDVLLSERAVVEALQRVRGEEDEGMMWDWPVPDAASA